MKLERLGSLTSELSSNLLKSIVVPQGGLLGWITRHRAERLRERLSALRPDARPDDALQTAMAEWPSGPVVLMGGAPVPDEAVVEAVHLAGGRSARMAIVPAAAQEDPAAAAASALRLFTRFGMKKAEIVELESRERATSPDWCIRLSEFDAVVLCGESTARGLQVLQATLAAVTLQEMLHTGKLLVGLNAGAAILGSRVFPGMEEGAPTAGLGILPGLLVDTEFTQRSRFSRLAGAMRAGEAGSMLGAGLDGGAAVVVQDGEARVVGEGSVTILDPRVQPSGSSAPVDGLKVHLMTEGYRLNLRMRRLMAPQKSEAIAR